MEQDDWPAYADPAGRFVIRYQPEWAVSTEGARIVIREPRGVAEFSIQYLAHDCADAQSAASARRLNYFLVQTFTRQVAGHNAETLEFRDTITNRRDFRAFLPVGKGCYELHWMRPDDRNLERTLDRMLSTFTLLAHRT